MGKKYNLHLKGYVGDSGFDPDYVDYVADRNEGRHLNVLVDSRGGDVAAGLSVSAAFARHGDVTVHYVGLNASAATIASMGAKRVTIDRGAMYLVHKCSVGFFDWSSKNADDFEQLIAECQKAKDNLDKIDTHIATLYASRCKGKTVAQLLDLMKVGGWLTPQEAMEWGFVDEVTSYAEDRAPVVDAATVAFFAAAGTPLPQMAVAADDKRSGLGSLVKLAVDALRSYTNSKLTYMNKTYKMLCALLACESLVLTDNSASLTDEQLQAVEDGLAAKDSRIAELEALVAEKDSRIAELEKEPADGGKQVVEDHAGADEDSYIATVRAARALYDAV